MLFRNVTNRKIVIVSFILNFRLNFLICCIVNLISCLTSRRHYFDYDRFRFLIQIDSNALRNADTYACICISEHRFTRVYTCNIVFAQRSTTDEDLSILRLPFPCSFAVLYSSPFHSFLLVLVSSRSTTDINIDRSTGTSRS